MRLFLACRLSENLDAYLRKIASMLPESRQTIPKNFDLTLKFFGNVSESEAEQIKQKLSSLYFEPFETHLDGIQVFSERLIRIVWVGLSNSDKFIELHHQIESSLSPLFPHDSRFHPHLTIARIKSLKNKEAFLEALSHIHVEPKTIYIDKIVLYESQLSAEGATHIPIYEIDAKKD